MKLLQRALAAGLLLVSSSAAARADDTTCLPDRWARLDAVDLVREAVGVLRVCGYDPADFRAEIRLEDPFAPTAEGRPRRWVAVFVPYDGSRHPTLAVGPSDPCTLSWVWDPSGFTVRQREVIDLAGRIARESRPAWSEASDPEIRVQECGEQIGVRIRADPTGPDELLILLDGKDLRVIRDG